MSSLSIKEDRRKKFLIKYKNHSFSLGYNVSFIRLFLYSFYRRYNFFIFNTNRNLNFLFGSIAYLIFIFELKKNTINILTSIRIFLHQL